MSHGRLFSLHHCEIGNFVVDDRHLTEKPYQMEVVEGPQEIGFAENPFLLAFIADIGVSQTVYDNAGALYPAILDIPCSGDVAMRRGVGVVAEFCLVSVDVGRNDHLIGSDAPKDEETLKIGPVSVAIGPFGREQHVINARESHVELFGSLVKVGGRHGTFEGDIEEVAARREDTACNRDNDKAAESRVCGGDELFHDGDRFTGTEC